MSLSHNGEACWESQDSAPEVSPQATCMVGVTR